MRWHANHAHVCALVRCLTTVRANAENLNVWRVATGERVAGFPQKLLNREARACCARCVAAALVTRSPAQQWPSIQWTADERVAMRVAGSQVLFYDGQNLGAGVVHRVVAEVRRAA